MAEPLEQRQLLAASLVSASTLGFSGSGRVEISEPRGFERWDGPTMTPDGRYVAFASTSALVPGVTGDFSNVYVRDRQNNTTILVSENSSKTGGGDWDSFDPVISSDGRYVYFTSSARNLLAGFVGNAAWQIFRRNLLNGTTELVSAIPGSTTTGGNGLSADPVISSDGRYVAFTSGAGNLAPGLSKTSDTFDIYWRDMHTGEARLVSRDRTQASLGGNAHSREPSISADGQRIVFVSEATNLAANDLNANRDVFVFDIAGNSLRPVSLEATGVTTANGHSDHPRLTPDGRYITFESLATNIASADTNGVSDVFWKDLQTGETRLASVSIRPGPGQGNPGTLPSYNAVISDNGRYVAFETYSTLTSDAERNDAPDVYRFDAQAGSVGTSLQLVSKAPGISGTGSQFGSSRPSISADGRFVAFVSGALDLSPLPRGKNNGLEDVYIADMTGDTIELLSVNNSATAATNGASTWAGMTPDARYILFASSATNIDPTKDNNSNLDLYAILSPLYPAPIVTAYSTSVLEGSGGSKTVTVTLKLNRAPEDAAASVAYTTVSGTASHPGDYTFTTGVATFNVGQTQATVVIPIVTDLADENDETFILALSSPAGLTLGGDATITIVDDDGTPEVSIADASIVEGNRGTGTLQVPVTLSSPSGNVVSVPYVVGGGTATNGRDYSSPAGGTLVFQPGQTQKTIDITIHGDFDVENDETFLIFLQQPTGAVIGGQNLATATILDDGDIPVPTLSVDGNPSGIEGQALTFTLRLSNVSPTFDRSVTLDYAIGGGTATAAADYVPQSGSITFAPGELEQTVVVELVQDARDEDDETLTLTIANVDNAYWSAAVTTGTILDDDPTPTLTIADASVTEGNKGTRGVSLAVSLSAASNRPVTVSYATAPKTALANIDYNSSSGMLLFSPGETTRTISLSGAILGDTLYEPNEIFYVKLRGPLNATLARSTGLVTIANDDPRPPEIVVKLGKTEIRDGQTTAVSFGTVRLNAAGPTRTFTVYNTGGTALSLGKISLPKGYQVVDLPPTLLAPGKSGTFTVRLLSGAAGARNGTISFSTNDLDENPFNFAVTGTVAVPKAAMKAVFSTKRIAST